MFKLNINTSHSVLIGACMALLISSPANAVDARSAALGGSAIAYGKGAYGALENPSALMLMQNNQQIFHLHLGASADIQDDAQLVDAVIDNTELPEDIENEIDIISNRVVTCPITSFPETLCLDDTQRLGDLASTVFSILENADDQPVKLAASANFGVAYTASSIPVALHYRQSIAVLAQSDITEGDLQYVNSFATVLADGQLTLDELFSAVPLSLSDNGLGLSVLQPEDALESDAQTRALIREQFGLSIATSFELGGHNLELGITPKYSELRASSLDVAIGERFDDDAESLQSQFDDNEVTDNSFTIDIGASTDLSDLSYLKRPMRLSVVARNIVKESITTEEGNTFETTPQLIVGAALALGSDSNYSFTEATRANRGITLTGDIALNKAKLDNIETQIIAAGIEFSRPLFSIRAGIGHDNARNENATAFSLGLSLGPLHIGGRLTDLESAQMGAQFSFTY